MLLFSSPHFVVVVAAAAAHVVVAVAAAAAAAAHVVAEVDEIDAVGTDDAASENVSGAVETAVQLEECA